MKKRIILAILAVCALLSSCAIFKYEHSYKKLTVFQTLSSYEALAYDIDYNVVKLVTYKDMIYDGKVFTGEYVLTGTYRYETKDERVKTVPVYMLLSEYIQQIKQ